MAHIFFFQLIESLKSGVTWKIDTNPMSCVNYLHGIVGMLELR